MNSAVPQVSPCVSEADIEDTTDAALKPISRRERGWGEGTSRRGLSIVSFGEGRLAGGNRIFGATDIPYDPSSRPHPCDGDSSQAACGCHVLECANTHVDPASG
ncbi:hypothetical protein XCCB100_2180 [Xanthomonas campestris pv. campestris]|uniref:Uncharacterized protein n=1 Tax=Xanthomonas campestris pv. campestris (strain B100) TaxID=509169 RepID=B0RSU7_XANCB|nr:hypothetical protein XCCB100_2180 [Xanthomonas campestris pv. campestris]